MVWVKGRFCTTGEVGRSSEMGDSWGDSAVVTNWLECGVEGRGGNGKI